MAQVYCERHPRWCGCHEDTDIVVVDVGPNRLAVMSALRGILDLAPADAKALMDGGLPIVSEGVYHDWEAEQRLKTAGATVERWVRVYCYQSLPGDPIDDGAEGGIA